MPTPAKVASRLHAHWPRVLGVSAFVAALFLFRSHENRPILGLWSHAWAIVLAAGVLLWLATVVLSLRLSGPERPPPTASRLRDAAIFLWGGAYLWSALADRSAASRIVDLNLFGSVAPGAALLEWLAMALLVASAVLWAAKRLGETGRNLLLSATAFGLVLLLLEGALRVRAAVAPQTQGFPTYTSRQWMQRYVSLNSEGFRDVEHAETAPAGQRRVLVVGDSFAFGVGVEDTADRVGEQLAHLLTQRLGTPWQSVSAALGDSHTLDEIAYLEQMEPYERDAVLLVYVFNDIDYLAPLLPRTALTGNPSGILDRIHPARLAFVNSYLSQELFVYGRLLSYALSDEPTRSERAYADEELLSRHLDDLVRFVEVASRGGTPVFIVPFDVAAADREPFAARYARFVESAAARGLTVLGLTGAFEGQETTALRVNRLDGHPNARAHELAALWLVEPMAAALAARGH